MLFLSPYPKYPMAALFLTQIFLRERNAINITALRASKIFTKLYGCNPKIYATVQGKKYEKRGYIRCKGHGKYSCKCSVGYTLINNYDKGGVNYVPPAEPIPDGGYTPIWQVDVATTICTNHNASCAYGKIKFSDIECVNMVITAADVARLRETLIAYAETLNSSAILNSKKLSDKLQLLISNERGIDFSDTAFKFHHYLVDTNATTSLQKIVMSVRGASGTLTHELFRAKKNPAATNGACLGTDGMDLSKVMDDPNLIICLKESVNERVIE